MAHAESDVSEELISPRVRLAITSLAIYSLGGGAISLLGWITDSPRLTDWFSHGISIQPNAALAALSCGAGLLLLMHGRREMAAALGAGVGVLGATTLFQYVGPDLPMLNQLLLFDRSWGNFGVISPGRMGPPASTCWTLLGVALVATSLGSTRVRRLAPVFAMSSFAIATLSIAGFMYRADLLYTLPKLTAIALQTATFIAALAAAAVAAVPERAPMRWLLADGAPGSVARWMTPLLALLPLLFGWMQLAGVSSGIYDARFGTALFVLATVAVLWTALVWTIKSIARHEAALREADARTKDALDSISDGFVSVDRNWRYRFINDDAERLMQTSRTDLLGRTVWEVFPELAAGRAYEMLHRCARERITVEYEDFSSSLERWFLNKVFPQRDGGISIYFEDVTQRKQMELQLATDLDHTSELQALSTRLLKPGDLNELLRAIVAAAGRVTGTDKGNVQLYDSTTQRLSIVAHQGFGEAFLDRFRHQGAASICQAVAIRRERIVVGDIANDPGLQASEDRAVLLADGIGAFQSTRLVSRDGRLLGILNNYYRSAREPSVRELRYVDVLARMAADVIEREQYEQALRDESRRKDAFIATLAHELRNPLAPMTNSLELLRRATGDAKIATKARDILERQLHQLTRLVDDLVDVSRISRDKVELRKERTQLRSIIDQAAEACGPLAQSLGHALDIRLNCGPIELYVDAARLAQVFGNLMNNALKYMPPNGRVVIQADLEGDRVLVRVIDSGIGIEVGELSEIFSMFNQSGRSLEQQQGGLGIGLYLVKKLVEMHGGTVDAHSQGLNCGSEFVVTLPVASASITAVDPSPPSTDIGWVTRLRFLIVEDNRDTAASLDALLRLHGHDTCVTHDGFDALAAAQTFQPDIVLLDIGLPKLNGYDTGRRIRQLPWSDGVVIIALTGWGQTDDRQRSQEAGFDHHLVKPVQYDVLMGTIAAARLQFQRPAAPAG